MTLTVSQMLERIDELQAAVDSCREEALSDGRIDRSEQARLDRLNARLARAHRQFMRHAERHPDGAGQPAASVSMEEEHVDGEHIGAVTFMSQQNAVRANVNTWRNSCKIEVGRMIRTMSEDNSEPFPRDLVVGIVASLLAPPVATALTAVNTAFTAVDTVYRARLPQAPKLVNIEEAWNNGMDEIDPDAIFNGLVAAFRRQYDIPANDDTISGSAVREWQQLTASVYEGDVLPSVESVKRDFMQLLYRAMPSQTIGPGSENMRGGRVRIRMEFDRESRAFSFVSGSLEDATEQMLNGLRTQPDIFGPLALDIPAEMEFRVYDPSFTPASRVCDIIRRGQEGGDTNFQFSPNGRSEYPPEEQAAVFELFMRGQHYRVPIRSVL